ncbi:MAG: V-type ATP synthase subunit I, partial [Clostridia bacterium]|nr:V-type ATP synthase subunit I [Clostridia bacterium]
RSDELIGICNEILSIERTIAEHKAEIVRLEISSEQLSAYEALDLPLSFTGTEKTVAAIGTVSGVLSLDDLLKKLAEAAPETEIYAETVGTASGQTAIFATAPRREEEAFNSALREIGFSRPSNTSELSPREELARIKDRKEALEKDISQGKERIASFAEYRNDIEVLSDWYLSKSLRIETQNSLDNSKHTVVITGYIPTCDLELLKTALTEKFTVHIENEAADPEEAPVKLKGNAFTEPAQSITAMYALPSAADIDPTPVTSFFYYFFFGIMLSDAGYGILMWIATWAVNKFLDPEPNMRKNMKLFMYCGISTTLWGLFFGSFFGVDIITAIFGQLPFKYPFINPMNGDAVIMLVLSLALGLVQILAGLAVKFRITLKSDGFLDAFLDTGLWITTLLGFTLLAVGMMLLPVLQTVGLIVAFGSMAGIAVFGGRKKKGAMKFIGGLASLYDITGYVSDLLSFSRLMALGLTTAAISMVFNMLGVMVSGGIIGKVFMVAVLLVGHAVNFGLNALGAYVHTLRLQYVELFSKFYDGGGRAFIPFAFKGKYIRIKEDK